MCKTLTTNPNATKGLASVDPRNSRIFGVMTSGFLSQSSSSRTPLIKKTLTLSSFIIKKKIQRHHPVIQKCEVFAS